MQDPTPLKQAGMNQDHDTRKLVTLVKQYIDLQVNTLDTLLTGGMVAAEECADKSNTLLQTIAEHIGYDYIGTMQSRIEAFQESTTGE